MIRWLRSLLRKASGIDALERRLALIAMEARRQ